MLASTCTLPTGAYVTHSSVLLKRHTLKASQGCAAGAGGRSLQLRVVAAGGRPVGRAGDARVNRPYRTSRPEEVRVATAPINLRIMTARRRLDHQQHTVIVNGFADATQGFNNTHPNAKRAAVMKKKDWVRKLRMHLQFAARRLKLQTYFANCCAPIPSSG